MFAFSPIIILTNICSSFLIKPFVQLVWYGSLCFLIHLIGLGKIEHLRISESYSLRHISPISWSSWFSPVDLGKSIWLSFLCYSIEDHLSLALRHEQIDLVFFLAFRYVYLVISMSVSNWGSPGISSLFCMYFIFFLFLSIADSTWIDFMSFRILLWVGNTLGGLSMLSISNSQLYLLICLINSASFSAKESIWLAKEGFIIPYEHVSIIKLELVTYVDSTIYLISKSWSTLNSELTHVLFSPTKWGNLFSPLPLETGAMEKIQQSNN